MGIRVWHSASFVVLLASCVRSEPPPRSPPSFETGGAERAPVEPVDGTLDPPPARSASPARDASDAAASPSTAAEAGPVFLNGVQLTEPDFAELEAILGQRPLPGRYWYDAVGGLWGLLGHGAGGVTRPGLTAALLPIDASAGTSGAFVNGRELPTAELAVMATLLGWPLPADDRYAGHYTLDAEGALNLFKGRYLGNVAAAAARGAAGAEPRRNRGHVDPRPPAGRGVGRPEPHPGG
jgi:hypothetical protein